MQPAMQPMALTRFWHSPFRSLLAYPHGDAITLKSRYQELQTHSVEGLYDFGPKQLNGFHLLGAGYCGLVFLARVQSYPIGLKVLRLNASRPSFDHEATMLGIANRVGIGPQYLGHSQHFLWMDYISGPSILNWIQSNPPLAIKAVTNTLRSLLRQAYQLDQVGLDHGNLSCATEHVIISPEGPVMIDFSSASTQRRPANVTSLVQGLFIGSAISPTLRAQALTPSITKAVLIDHLRSYKKNPGQQQFDTLLQLLNLNDAE